MRLTFVIIVALTLMMPAAAQAATVELSASNAPAEAEVTAGESVDLSFDVALNVSDTACAEDVELPGNGTATVQQGATAEDAPFSFTVPAGEYTLVGEHEDQTSVTVTVDTEPGVTEDYTMDVGLQAVTTAVQPENCSSEFPAAESDTLTTTLIVAADQEPEEEEEEDEEPEEEDPASGEPPEEEEQDESPLPALVALLAVGLAAIFRR